MADVLQWLGLLTLRSVANQVLSVVVAYGVVSALAASLCQSTMVIA
jgi:hypothetical protein